MDVQSSWEDDRRNRWEQDEGRWEVGDRRSLVDELLLDLVDELLPDL